MKDKEKQIDNSWKAKMVENGIYKDSEITSEEKQIEEMAKKICNACKTRVSEQQCNSYKREVYGYCSMCKIIAKELLKHYQPKLPKDSVVLSREEYEKLTKKLVTEQRAKEIAQEYFGIVRKETAEKIIHLVGMLPIPRQVSNRYGVGFENALTVVKLEIAKQFGVEIKE